MYSLHEPEVECISKGKEHKKYEFGNKSAIAKTYSGLIVSTLAFQGNPYDGHTLPAHLEQVRRLTGYTPKEACDRPWISWKETGWKYRNQYSDLRLPGTELLPETKGPQEVLQACRHRTGYRPPEI